jgi:hypothetical protein
VAARRPRGAHRGGPGGRGGPRRRRDRALEAESRRPLDPSAWTCAATCSPSCCCGSSAGTTPPAPSAGRRATPPRRCSAASLTSWRATSPPTTTPALRRRARAAARRPVARARAATGRTTKELVMDRVMLEAARLLAFTDRPVGEISHRTGLRGSPVLLAQLQAPPRRGPHGLPRAAARARPEPAGRGEVHASARPCHGARAARDRTMGHGRHPDPSPASGAPAHVLPPACACARCTSSWPTWTGPSRGTAARSGC